MEQYGISVFDCNVYSDELIEVTPEEAEEVFRLIAEEREAFDNNSSVIEETERHEGNVYCYLCKHTIAASQPIEHHHPIYKSNGGTQTAPTHKACHRQYHSEQADFAAWGRIGGQLTALTRRWAFNLNHVRNNPVYELDRKFYLAYYAS